MSKKNKSVFDKQTEALQTIADELQTLNSILVGLGNLMIDIYGLIANMDKTLSDFATKPVKADVDMESLAKAISQTRGWTTSQSDKKKV